MRFQFLPAKRKKSLRENSIIEVRNAQKVKRKMHNRKKCTIEKFDFNLYLK